MVCIEKMGQKEHLSLIFSWVNSLPPPPSSFSSLFPLTTTFIIPVNFKTTHLESYTTFSRFFLPFLNTLSPSPLLLISLFSPSKLVLQGWLLRYIYLSISPSHFLFSSFESLQFNSIQLIKYLPLSTNLDNVYERNSCCHGVIRRGSC